MNSAIVLNNEGYEPFLDFLKGLCIISVVLTHNIPYVWQNVIGFPFWGAQAVPIFLIIQSYHVFKRNEFRLNIYSLLRRIVLPFILIQSIFIIEIFVKYFCGSGLLTTPILNFIKSGGEGPGSYYFWIYLEFALVLLPLCFSIQKHLKFKLYVCLLAFTFVSELAEILCSFIELKPWLYRLLAFRYIFLVFGGIIWAKHGIVLNKFCLILSIISVVCIYLFQYKKVSFEPWVFDTEWRYFHWFCYFYSICLLSFIANKSYRVIQGGVFAILVSKCGKYSYQIYLLQLVVFSFFPYDCNKMLYLVSTTVLSIVPVLLYYKIKSKCLTIVK